MSLSLVPTSGTQVFIEAGTKDRDKYRIPQILWDVITCPCPWYLHLAHTSSFTVSASVNIALNKRTWQTTQAHSTHGHAEKAMDCAVGDYYTTCSSTDLQVISLPSRNASKFKCVSSNHSGWYGSAEGPPRGVKIRKLLSHPDDLRKEAYLIRMT